MDGKPYHHGDLKKALVEAGLKELAARGAAGLSLRRVAELAGVSHSAPYAHFADKNALLAAIAEAGFQQLLAQLQSAVAAHPGDSPSQIVGAACAYSDFAQQHRELFQLMFSSPLATTKEYPELVAVTDRLFQLVVGVVADQDHPADAGRSAVQLRALILWGQVHGIVQLALENQISSSLLQAYSLDEILTHAVRGNFSSNGD